VGTGKKQVQPVGSDSGGVLIDQLRSRTCAMKAKEVIALIGMSRSQFYRLVEERRIPHFRIGTVVRFDPGHIARWLEEKAA
jgi:excisionase family DNA binding protein